MEPDELISMKVQYVSDTDPFNSLALFPLPSRAPVYSFPNSAPLATQLGALLRLLGAPQRVSYYNKNFSTVYYKHKKNISTTI